MPSLTSRHPCVSTCAASGGRVGVRRGRLPAIGLGCEIRHAHRIVYSDGLDLTSASAATPIGVGCRVCERLDCRQRAAPPLGHPLRIDKNTSAFVPYPVSDATNVPQETEDR
ncbi:MULTISPECIES: short-chain fatty acyl-CoA regulator family protein [Streptomyces]|uniref:Short-chain fatty acyl-CoA regulator family protein n=1 Tax=Streptomyces gibsoniae TaxID=3075529 RepID=A0ABU2U8M4_9ACTN|nr:short-chain fatty acyl-CoA regulator family protein [Streptomyces sp. DSM 41699]MDT0469578.1 short-chain fatty acyl-CoA regulator family protein [Streptomyces sp. DSM 41699]